MELLAECSRRLSGNADHTEAVHAVRCDLILKDRIVQAQSLYRALSHDRILRENIDAVLRRFRVHLTAGSQLFDGAHHACTLHSAEFALFDLNAALDLLARLMSAGHASSVQNDRDFVPLFHVRGAGHDLDRLCPDIHLADDQLVRVRMLLYLIDLSDHDLVQIRIQLLISLNLCPGQCHRVCIFLRSHIKIRNICLYP